MFDLCEKTISIMDEMHFSLNSSLNLHKRYYFISVFHYSLGRVV